MLLIDTYNLASRIDSSGRWKDSGKQIEKLKKNLLRQSATAKHGLRQGRRDRMGFNLGDRKDRVKTYGNKSSLMETL